MFPPALARRFHDPDFFVVQVGANDGRLDDPIHEHIRSSQCAGLLIEPIPWVFERLQRNYEGLPRLRFECVALADYEGTCTLWHLPRHEAESDDWDLSVLATTRRALFTHPLCVDPADAREVDDGLVQLDLPCTTLQRVLDKHELRHVDLLQIDTQGQEYEILRSLDFERIKPPYINYEHVLLEEREAPCRQMLEALGYRCMPGLDERYDTLAVLIGTSVH